MKDARLATKSNEYQTISELANPATVKNQIIDYIISEKKSTQKIQNTTILYLRYWRKNI
jgi:hypothetical protein